jgi:hypothetical protein
VHESTLLMALKTLYSIHMTSNSQTNTNTAKGAFTQMVNTIFSKMDVYLKNGSATESLDLKKLEKTTDSNGLERALHRRSEESKDDMS